MAMSKFRLKKTIGLTAGMLCLFVSNILAQIQVPGYDIRRIGYQNGLQNQIINAVVKDQDNVLWFGTMKGIYRFDGLQVLQIDSNYYNVGGNTAQFITNLAIDPGPNGVIFVSTKNGARLIDLRSNALVSSAGFGIPDSLFNGFSQIASGTGGVFWGLRKNTVYAIRKTGERRYSCQASYDIPPHLNPNKLVGDSNDPNAVWLLFPNWQVWHVGHTGVQKYLLPIPRMWGWTMCRI